MPRILVVDDEPLVRELLHEYFSSQGYDVTTAATGAEGLQRLREERPHLVLLDISLPDLSGLEVLRTAKGIDPAVSVIILTGLLDETVRRQALEAGALAYVTKPMDLHHLEHMIRYKLTGITLN